VVQDKINQMKSVFVEDLAKMETVRADLSAKIALCDAAIADLETEKKSEYDRGFNDGLLQAGQAGGSDKIYSDAELEAELAPLREQIVALTSQVTAFEAQVKDLEATIVELQSKVPSVDQPAVDLEAVKKQAADEAVAAFKAMLKEKMDAQQASETAGEVAVRALLD